MMDPASECAIENLLKSGAIKDFNWPSDVACKKARELLKLWRKKQESIQYTESPVKYITLKEDSKSTSKHLAVLDTATAGDSSKFMVIPSSETHHAIVDSNGFLLGYRYCIPNDKLDKLIKSTTNLPFTRADAGKRGQYPTCHYTVWCKYTTDPFYSKEYMDDHPVSEEWCNANQELFKYLTNGLRMISPDTYARYAGAREYLGKNGLEPCCGVWFGVAINQDVTGDTGIHQDLGDHGYNCVVPWGEYKGGELILWQLEMAVELWPGDAFFFIGSLIAHNIQGVKGVQHSIDLFCDNMVLSWKDKCDEKR